MGTAEQTRGLLAGAGGGWGGHSQLAHAMLHCGGWPGIAARRRVRWSLNADFNTLTAVQAAAQVFTQATTRVVAQAATQVSAQAASRRVACQRHRAHDDGEASVVVAHVAIVYVVEGKVSSLLWGDGGTICWLSSLDSQQAEPDWIVCAYPTVTEHCSVHTHVKTMDHLLLLCSEHSLQPQKDAPVTVWSFSQCVPLLTPQITNITAPQTSVFPRMCVLGVSRTCVVRMLTK